MNLEVLGHAPIVGSALPLRADSTRPACGSGGRWRASSASQTGVSVGGSGGRRAEVDVAFVGAVEIAAARGEQVELARRLGVALGLGRGVAAGHHLDAARRRAP